MEHVRGFGRGHSGHLILGNIITKENINTHTDVKQGSMYSQTQKNTHSYFEQITQNWKKNKYDMYICQKYLDIVWP